MYWSLGEQKRLLSTSNFWMVFVYDKSIHFMFFFFFHKSIFLWFTCFIHSFNLYFCYSFCTTLAYSNHFGGCARVSFVFRWAHHHEMKSWKQVCVCVCVCVWRRAAGRHHWLAESHPYSLLPSGRCWLPVFSPSLTEDTIEKAHYLLFKQWVQIFSGSFICCIIHL